METNRPCYVLCALVALVTVLGGAVVHLLNWFQEAVHWGIFPKTENSSWTWDSAVEDGQPRYLVAEWVFYMWALGYVALVITLLYGLELLCRKGPVGSHMGLTEVLPSGVYILVMFSAASVLAWLSLWTRDDLWLYAPLCLLGSCFFIYAALFISVAAINERQATLYSTHSYQVVWENQMLVHNCLGLFGSWVTVVMIYSVSFVLGRSALLPKVDQEAYVCLGLIALYLFVWFVMDMSVGRHHTPHLVTPYVTVVIAAVQTLLVNQPHSYIFICAIVLLLVSAVLLLVKISLSVGLLVGKDTYMTFEKRIK